MVEHPDLLDGAIPPEKNTALFGHDQALDFLAESYRSGRMHHAILIEGLEGIGKATLAFRFANHVISYPEPAMAPSRIAAPDPDSPAFRQIASGASHNLIHLRRPVDEKTGKVKSVITVDAVRRLAHFFAQTSGTGNWRIAIVDPADDLNRNAANALLKILEEPPRRSLFLVLSHTPGRLLPTIRSRCMALSLSPLGRGEMEHALEHLKIRLDLDQNWSASEGSVARALMLANYGGADIAEAFDVILKSGNCDDRASIHRLAEMLAARDRDVAYQFFMGHVVDRVREQAVEAARAGASAIAARHAERASAIIDHFEKAEAYNLDRKQTVLNLFPMILD